LCLETEQSLTSRWSCITTRYETSGFWMQSDSICYCQISNTDYSQVQWPRRVRRGSAAACLLGLRVRLPSGALISVCFECCVSSGRGLCEGPIPPSEESYKGSVCHWV
jgi:hypothetical protein